MNQPIFASSGLLDSRTIILSNHVLDHARLIRSNLICRRRAPMRRQWRTDPCTRAPSRWGASNYLRVAWDASTPSHLLRAGSVPNLHRSPSTLFGGNFSCSYFYLGDVSPEIWYYTRIQTLKSSIGDMATQNYQKWSRFNGNFMSRKIENVQKRTEIVWKVVKQQLSRQLCFRTNPLNLSWKAFVRNCHIWRSVVPTFKKCPKNDEASSVWNESNKTRRGGLG